MQTHDATAHAKQPRPAVDWYRDIRTASTPVLLQYATTLALTAGATVIAAGFDQGVTIPNLSLIYVLPVIAAAVMFGLGPSLFAAVMGALAYNYFFTSPRFSLAVDDPANIWAIVLLFLTGCAASAVASTGRRQADGAKMLELRQENIRRFTKVLVSERDVDGALNATVDLLRSLYEVPVAVVMLSDDGAERSALWNCDALAAAEREAVSSAIAAGDKVTGGVFPYDQSRFDLWPVKVPGANSAVVLGLAFDGDQRPERLDDIVEPIAALLALWLACDSRRQAASPD